jgi:Mg-chelatase subunit ChlD
MNAKWIGTGLLTLTAAAVAFYPYVDSSATSGQGPVDRTDARQRIEVVFVLDTTSSMTGLIAAAKEKIWSIATTLAQAEQAPDIEMGLVAFRDRGDEYVTQVIDLSSDLDTMYAQLMDFAAVGGGDGPESVNAALEAAVERISWSQDPSSYQVIFLVGDAPPHMDYQSERQYPAILLAAEAKGIVVNTIQCGDLRQTASYWAEIARLGNGRYLKVGQAGDAFAVATPYDAEIAQLSAALDRTRLFYGTEEQMGALSEKVEATERLEAEATVGSRVRRAAFNATAAGARNLFGEQDLVADIASGEVTLQSVPAAELPARVRELSPDEQQSLIDNLAATREDLTARIDALSEARAAFIEERVDAADGAAGSLDRQIYDTVREQAAPRGLSFEGGPSF